MDKWVLVTKITEAGIPVKCYERTQIDGKAVSTRENLQAAIKTWSFSRTKPQAKAEPHWLWRTSKPYRLTASGIC